MMPPWRQWLDSIVPVSAKKGDVRKLKELMRKKLEGNKK
jgi:hypothetical protein